MPVHHAGTKKNQKGKTSKARYRSQYWLGLIARPGATQPLRTNGFT